MCVIGVSFCGVLEFLYEISGKGGSFLVYLGIFDVKWVYGYLQFYLVRVYENGFTGINLYVTCICFSMALNIEFLVF